MPKSKGTHASPMVDTYKAPTAPKGAVSVSGKLEAVVSNHGVANLPKGHGSKDLSPLVNTFKKK